MARRLGERRAKARQSEKEIKAKARRPPKNKDLITGSKKGTQVSQNMFRHWLDKTQNVFLQSLLSLKSRSPSIKRLGKKAHQPTLVPRHLNSETLRILFPFACPRFLLNIGGLFHHIP